MTARPLTKKDLIFSPTIVAMASTIARLSAEGLLKPIVRQLSSIDWPLVNHLLVWLRCSACIRSAASTALGELRRNQLHYRSIPARVTPSPSASNGKTRDVAYRFKYVGVFFMAQPKLLLRQRFLGRPHQPRRPNDKQRAEFPH
jgi:hypothetical protein